MIEVLVTDIKDSVTSHKVMNMLSYKYQKLRINIDLDETGKPFPCGQSILRLEGENINAQAIISDLESLGIIAYILEDKVCK